MCWKIYFWNVSRCCVTSFRPAGKFWKRLGTSEIPESTLSYSFGHQSVCPKIQYSWILGVRALLPWKFLKPASPRHTHIKYVTQSLSLPFCPPEFNPIPRLFHIDLYTQGPHSSMAILVSCWSHALQCFTALILLHRTINVCSLKHHFYNSCLIQDTFHLLSYKTTLSSSG